MISTHEWRNKLGARSFFSEALSGQALRENVAPGSFEAYDAYTEFLTFRAERLAEQLNTFIGLGKR